MKSPRILMEEIDLHTLIEHMMIILNNQKDETSEQEIIATICGAIYIKMLPAEYQYQPFQKHRINPYHTVNIPGNTEKKCVHNDPQLISCLENGINRKKINPDALKRILLNIEDLVRWSAQSKITLPPFISSPDGDDKKKEPSWASKARKAGKTWYLLQANQGNHVTYDDMAKHLAKNQKGLGISDKDDHLKESTIRREALIGSGIIKKKPKPKK